MSQGGYMCTFHLQAALGFRCLASPPRGGALPVALAVASSRRFCRTDGDRLSSRNLTL